MDGGWIKLHRKLLDNPVVTKDADHIAVWIWLLLHVAHRPKDVLFKGKRITLQPGQMTVGRRQIAEELSINESKIKRILKEFKSDQQIDQQASSKCSLISVTKWLDYQNNDPQNGQQVTSKWPLIKNERIKEYKYTPKEKNTVDENGEDLGFIRT